MVAKLQQPDSLRRNTVHLIRVRASLSKHKHTETEMQREKYSLSCDRRHNRLTEVEMDFLLRSFTKRERERERTDWKIDGNQNGQTKSSNGGKNGKKTMEMFMMALH